MVIELVKSTVMLDVSLVHRHGSQLKAEHSDGVHVTERQFHSCIGTGLNIEERRT
jgi:hypothetical protein